MIESKDMERREIVAIILRMRDKSGKSERAAPPIRGNSHRLGLAAGLVKITRADRAPAADRGGSRPHYSAYIDSIMAPYLSLITLRLIFCVGVISLFSCVNSAGSSVKRFTFSTCPSSFVMRSIFSR